MSVAALHVRAEELEIVHGILGKVIPGQEVWAFGSRLTGRVKKYSDLDLVILGEEPLPLGVMGELVEAFTESDLPYKVDLVDWASASERFLGWWKRRMSCCSGSQVSEARPGAPGTRRFWRN